MNPIIEENDFLNRVRKLKFEGVNMNRLLININYFSI